jgi:hypothetical protein
MITIGTRLCTKDGRLIGNGIVVDILTFPIGYTSFTAYLVKTDFGNMVTMSMSQISNQFYIADDVVPPKIQLLAQLVLLDKVMEMYYGD